jgi:hypothetical protein
MAKRRKEDPKLSDSDSEFAQQSWVGGGRVQQILSADRLKEATETDGDMKAHADKSWHTHSVEEEKVDPKP